MCGESFQLIRAILHLTYLKSYLAHTFRHLCRSSVKCNLSITYQHKFRDIEIPLESCFFSAVNVNHPGAGDRATVASCGQAIKFGQFRTFEIEI